VKDKTTPTSDTVPLNDRTHVEAADETAVGPLRDGQPKGAERLQVGSVLKQRFVLESVIGAGGMGVIFKARDRLKEEMHDRKVHVAIKVLNDQLKGSADLLVALQREARKSQELAHPNIITVYDFDRDGNHVFMTMEYLQGMTLDPLLKNKGLEKSSLDQRWKLIRAIGRGLAYAHEKKVIHYDVKPGNIFICDDGSVKVLDFGIAKAMRTPLEDDRTVFDEFSPEALTPPYASYEMLTQDTPDYRDDIYAFACVAYEILSGRHPFNRLPATQARARHLTPKPIPGLSSRQWKGLCHGLMFERKRRTKSIDDFLKETLGTGSGHWLMRLSWIAGAILAAGMIAWVGREYGKTATAPEPQPSQPRQVQPKQLQPTPRRPLSVAEKKTIADLLEIAPLHFALGRVAAPPGSNALDAYQRILAIDPQHTQAILGLKQSVHACEPLARKKLDEDQQEAARKLVETCLQAMPDHAGLLDLKNRLDQLEQRDVSEASNVSEAP
jgi:serine/threonine protein kinase